MRIASAMVGLLCCLCAACSKESNPSPAGPIQDASPANDTTATESGRPPITVPDRWMRPAECLGVGNLCSMGCTGSACQLLGDVCIPRWGSGGLPGWSPETPYCMAYTCMTYEQASCFCTGAAAAQFPSCKSGPAAVAGLCAGEQSACVNGACCNGLKCVNISPKSGICYQSCTANTDCDTGCCTDLRDTGERECAPKSACENPCGKTGATCTDPGQCCNGTCVTDTTDPGWLGCRSGCTANADCASGCCQPFANGGGFCADARYCGCGGIDKSCAEGSSCATLETDGGAFACYPNCKTASDCASMCCTQHFPDKDYGICIDRSNCQP